MSEQDSERLLLIFNNFERAKMAGRGHQRLYLLIEPERRKEISERAGQLLPSVNIL